MGKQVPTEEPEHLSEHLAEGEKCKWSAWLIEVAQREGNAKSHGDDWLCVFASPSVKVTCPDIPLSERTMIFARVRPSVRTSGATRRLRTRPWFQHLSHSPYRMLAAPPVPFRAVSRVTVPRRCHKPSPCA